MANPSYIGVGTLHPLYFSKFINLTGNENATFKNVNTKVLEILYVKAKLVLEKRLKGINRYIELMRIDNARSGPSFPIVRITLYRDKKAKNYDQ